MGPWTYYRLWARTAFSGALDRAALGAFVVLALYGAAQHFEPRLSGAIEPWVWAVPFWALALVVAFRALWAPYKIWKDNQTQIVALSAAPDIPKHALLITADTESVAADENKGALNLRVKNTTTIPLEVGEIVGYFRVNAGEPTPIKCKAYLLHVGGACSYQFPLGESLKEPKEGAIEMVIRLTYGLPGEAAARAVDQSMNIIYQNLGVVVPSQCSPTACSETEI